MTDTELFVELLRRATTEPGAPMKAPRSQCDHLVPLKHEYIRCGRMANTGGGVCDDCIRFAPHPPTAYPGGPVHRCGQMRNNIDRPCRSIVAAPGDRCKCHPA